MRLLTASDAEFVEAMYAENRFEEQARAMEQVLVTQKMRLKLPTR